MVLPLRDGDVASLGYTYGVSEGLLVTGKHGRHLFCRLQEELVAGVAQALRIVDGFSGADAEQDVVRLVVALPQVMDVVGGDQWQVQFPRQRDDAAIDHLLLFDALVLHLEKEVVAAKDVAQPCRGLECRPRLLRAERAGHFALQATAQTDETLRVLCEQVFVDAWAVIKPLGVSGGNELDQIPVALVRFGQEHQMIRFGLRPALVEPTSLRDVDLAAEDWFEPAIPCMIMEDD